MYRHTKIYSKARGWSSVGNHRSWIKVPSLPALKAAVSGTQPAATKAGTAVGHAILSAPMLTMLTIYNDPP